MIDRIKKLMDLKNMTATQFSEAIEIQRSSLSHVLSGRNKPSLDFMLKIKNTFPEVNLDWLLLGEGDYQSGMNDQEFLDADLNVQDNAQPGFEFESESKNATKETSRVEEKVFETKFKNDERKNPGKDPVKIIMFYADNTFESFNNR